MKIIDYYTCNYIDNSSLDFIEVKIDKPEEIEDLLDYFSDYNCLINYNKKNKTLRIESAYTDMNVGSAIIEYIIARKLEEK